MALEKAGTILQCNDINEVYQDLINTYLFMYCFCFFLNVFSAVHLLVLFICFVGFYSAIVLKVDLLVTFNWSPSSCHHAFSVCMNGKFINVKFSYLGVLSNDEQQFQLKL